MEYLLNGMNLNKIDATEPEIMDYHMIPDHLSLSNQLKVGVLDTVESLFDFRHAPKKEIWT